MAAKNKKHRAGRKFTLPLAVIAGMTPLVYGTVDHALKNGLVGPGDTGYDYFIRSLTGYSPNYGFKFGYYAKWGLLPIVLGLVVHKGANMFGLNRALASANVPIIRL